MLKRLNAFLWGMVFASFVSAVAREVKKNPDSLEELEGSLDELIKSITGQGEASRLSPRR